MKIKNLFDQRLWEAAQWREVAFLLTPDLDQPGGLALGFENFAAGLKIFTNWRNRLGESDTRELLRVAILHGTTPAHENGYTVHLTTDPTALVAVAKPKPQTMMFWSQYFYKQTPSSQSLQWFITNFERHRRYFIFPLPIMRPAPDLSVYFNHRLWKTKLHHCDYSKVKPTDVDAIALPR